LDLEEVNAVRSGPYMSSAMVAGMYILRCAVGSKLTEERHVKDAWEVVQDRASNILRQMETIYSQLHYLGE
jgi:tyrosine decarboxylase